MKIGKFFAQKLSFTKSMNYFSYEPIVSVHKCEESWYDYEILIFEVLINGLFNSCSL